jgi:hypothetical protein
LLAKRKVGSGWGSHSIIARATQVPQLIAQVFDWPAGEQAKMTQLNRPGI